jgi:uncharacterized protein (DUF927 family)
MAEQKRLFGRVGPKMSAEYQRRYRAKHPEKAKAREKAYRDSHRAKFNRSQDEWRKRNPDKVQAIQIRRKLKKYGLTPEEYNRLRALQDGRCAICRRHETKGKSFDRLLAVDHCHATGVNRGLLCVNCNAILGHAQDSTAVLLAAIAYLERPWR